MLLMILSLELSISFKNNENYETHKKTSRTQVFA